MSNQGEMKLVDENSKVVPLSSPAARPSELEPSKPNQIGQKLSRTFFLRKQVWFKPTISNITLVLLVLLPTFATATYMWVFAKDQYIAKASFVVRSNSGSTAGDMLGLLSQPSSDSPTADSYIIIDYLSSVSFANSLIKSFNLEQIYGTQIADWHFAMKESPNSQDIADYWASMHDIYFDAASGMLSLQVRAFSPEHANLLTEFSVKEASNLIEKMSREAREDQVKFSKREVALAELRLRDVRRRLNEFRNKTGILDPELAVANAISVISELKNKKIAAENERATLAINLSEDAPSIRRLDDQIRVLGDQIIAQQSAIDGSQGALEENGQDTLSLQLGDYEEIAVEKGFAEQAYTAALSALEQSRVKAANTQKYLSIVEKPEPLHRSDYPNRPLWVILVFIICFAIWAILSLVAANLRIRR